MSEKKGDFRQQWRTLRTLAGYLWPADRADLRTRVVLALVSLVLAKVVNVTTPLFYKGAVDALTISPESAALVVPAFLMIGYGLARLMASAFGELRDYLFVPVSQYAQRTSALETFKHLHKLSLAFHLERRTGGLTRAIERGTAGIQFVLAFMLFNILPTLLELGMVTAVLASAFGAGIALTTLGTIGSYIVFTLVTTNWRLRFRRAMNESDSEANTKAVDSLLNYETVKYFGNEAHEHLRYDKSLRRYEQAAVTSQGSLSLLNVGQSLIIALGLVVIMWQVAQGVVNGTYSVGDFVLVNTYLIQLYLPLGFLGFVYRQVRQSLIDMESMFELLAVSPDVTDIPGAPELKLRGGAVEFRSVCFGYTKERPILKGVSFSVPVGKHVALVGPSGAGKSTISRLLYRFYQPDQGGIFIDGQDIQEVQQSSLRSCIGIVPQDTVLFNDSILYNIRYGRPEATDEEVFEAARLARIHDFIVQLPDAYETTVGERGLKLSGGEKQRVAIARTLLKRPQILIFDEATSALDSATEQEIQRSLREVSIGRTTLMIAHRLSTIVDADEILVLKQGEIIERGTHEELLSANKTYADMWRKQQKDGLGSSAP